GLPVVSTRVGAEGLELCDGRDLILAEPEQMAEALSQCLRDPAPGLAMAAHGREFVLKRYEWDALAVKLEAAWEESLRARTSKVSTLLSRRSKVRADLRSVAEQKTG